MSTVTQEPVNTTLLECTLDRLNNILDLIAADCQTTLYIGVVGNNNDFTCVPFASQGTLYGILSDYQGRLIQTIIAAREFETSATQAA